METISVYLVVNTEGEYLQNLWYGTLIRWGPAKWAQLFNSCKDADIAGKCAFNNDRDKFKVVRFLFTKEL